METKKLNIKKPDFSKVKDLFKHVNKEWFVANIKLEMLALFVVASIVMILVSYLVLDVPFVTACAFIILETLLCAFLNQTPIWVHGVVLVLQISAGFLFNCPVFTILMAIVYVVALVLLYIWTKDQA